MRLVYAFVTMVGLAVAGCGPTTETPPPRDLLPHEVTDGAFPDLSVAEDAAGVDQGVADQSTADESVAPDRDLSLVSDLRTIPDLASPVDLKPVVILDLTPIVDLKPIPDLTTPPDLLTPPDLTLLPDLATTDCSPMLPDGLCAGANEHCYFGACKGPCAIGLNGWCAATTDTCDASSGTCVPASAPIAAETLISEVLIDPPLTGDAGEYVELFNPTSKVLNLKNCYLRSQSGGSTEQTAAFGDLTIAPLHVSLLQRTAAGATFDFTPAASFGTISFANGSADWVALHCGAIDVDGIGWSANTAFPNLMSVPANVSWERSRASLLAGGAATANTTWCKSTETHTASISATSATYLGSPGKANTCL